MGPVQKLWLTGRYWLDQGDRKELKVWDRPYWQCPSEQVIVDVSGHSRTFPICHEPLPYEGPCYRTNPVHSDQPLGRWADCRPIRYCSRRPMRVAVHRNRPILRSRSCDLVAIFADLSVRKMFQLPFDRWLHRIRPAVSPCPSCCRQSTSGGHSLLFYF